MLQLAQILLGFFSGPAQFQQLALEPPAIRWECTPLKYTEGPTLRGSILRARLVTTCNFDAINGGGFPRLNAHLHERVVREAERVHAGPIDVTYKDLPSKQYDLTAKVGSATDYSRIRQNVFIGTDERTLLNFDSLSTSITGEGNGEYLKKTNILATTRKTDVAATYGLAIEGYFELEKPWYAPGGIFIREVRAAIERNTAKLEKELITDLAENL